MANPTHPQNNAEKNAQKYFRKAEQSDTLVKEMRKKEKATTAAKTAKLRGLSIKESADKEEADRAAAAKADGPQPQSKRKRAAPKPAPMVRMTY